MNRHRPRTDPNGLPSPWAVGDVLELTRTPTGDVTARLYPHRRPVVLPFGALFTVVEAAPTGHGDSWVYRVTGTRTRSEALYVTFPGRSFGLPDRNDLDCFDLLATLDPDGLRERSRLIAAGWTPPATSPPPLRSHP